MLVDNVEPFELRKLRLLNGAHSTLAYAGLLKGITFVHEAIADDDLRRLVEGVWQEAAQTLPRELMASTKDYTDRLVARFSNKALNHRLDQIAMDGSQKIPIRLLSAARQRRQSGLASPFLDQAIEAWVQWVARTVSRVGPDGLSDPRAAELAAAARTVNPSIALKALVQT